jgi:hypothetical protein
MMTITIRLPDVEAAMLAEVQMRSENLKSRYLFLSKQMHIEYARRMTALSRAMSWLGSSWNTLN